MCTLLPVKSNLGFDPLSETKNIVEQSDKEVELLTVVSFSNCSTDMTTWFWPVVVLNLEGYPAFCIWVLSTRRIFKCEILPPMGRRTKQGCGNLSLIDVFYKL